MVMIDVKGYVGTRGPATNGAPTTLVAKHLVILIYRHRILPLEMTLAV
jgi:hypothetical protein